MNQSEQSRPQHHSRTISSSSTRNALTGLILDLIFLQHHATRPTRNNHLKVSFNPKVSASRLGRLIESLIRFGLKVIRLAGRCPLIVLLLIGDCCCPGLMGTLD